MAVGILPTTPRNYATMAPPSTSLSRLGQINKVGADDALFLKQFGGEILTEFEPRLTPLL